MPQIEAARSFPFLVYDGPDWQAGMRCVACQICEKECPPKCILIKKSADKKPDAVGKPQFYPAVFDIDISVCMSCQICVEVCPFDAIKMDVDYDLRHRRPLCRPAARQAAARQIQRVLPPDPPHRSRRRRCAPRRRTRRSGRQGQGRRRSAKAAAASRRPLPRPSRNPTSGEPRHDDASSIRSSSSPSTRCSATSPPPRSRSSPPSSPSSPSSSPSRSSSPSPPGWSAKASAASRTASAPTAPAPSASSSPSPTAIKSLTKEDIVPLQRRPRRPFSRAAAAGRRRLPRLRRPAHRPQHGAGQPQRRRPLLLRRRLHRRTRRLHGRLVQPQQVLAARGHARRRPDDQLRSPAGPRLRRRHHAGRLALHRRHCRTSRPPTPTSCPIGSSSPPGALSASSSS